MFRPSGIEHKKTAMWRFVKCEVMLSMLMRTPNLLDFLADTIIP